MFVTAVCVIFLIKFKGISSLRDSLFSLGQKNELMQNTQTRSSSSLYSLFSNKFFNKLDMPTGS